MVPRAKHATGTLAKAAPNPVVAIKRRGGSDRDFLDRRDIVPAFKRVGSRAKEHVAVLHLNDHAASGQHLAAGIIRHLDLERGLDKGLDFLARYARLGQRIPIRKFGGGPGTGLIGRAISAA
ncbi:MAG: hypothetical protein ABGW82_10335 [Paracoccus sp. (in: a-proteobacteria)]